MPEPFDWTRCPEAAGPSTEPRARGGTALDTAALAQGQVRLPQLNQAFLAAGELVPLTAPDPYHGPDERERWAAERDQAAARYDTGREALRSLFEGAARGAGASHQVARATADALLDQAAPVPLSATERELMDELLARAAAEPEPAPAGQPAPEPAAATEPAAPVAQAEPPAAEPEAVTG